MACSEPLAGATCGRGGAAVRLSAMLALNPCGRGLALGCSSMLCIGTDHCCHHYQCCNYYLCCYYCQHCYHCHSAAALHQAHKPDDRMAAWKVPYVTQGYSSCKQDGVVLVGRRLRNIWCHIEVALVVRILGCVGRPACASSCLALALTSSMLSVSRLRCSSSEQLFQKCLMSARSSCMFTLKMSRHECAR